MVVSSHTLESHAKVRGLALVSGSLGALASCFGKGAFGDVKHDEDGGVMATFLSNPLAQLVCSADKSEHCLFAFILAYRCICLFAMIGCNALMLGSFVQGMHESGSVAGTALANAANFIVSAAMGWLMFNEEYSLQWFYGFLMVLVGTVLLSSVQSTDAEKLTKRD